MAQNKKGWAWNRYGGPDLEIERIRREDFKKEDMDQPLTLRELVAMEIKARTDVFGLSFVRQSTAYSQPSYSDHGFFVRHPNSHIIVPHNRYLDAGTDAEEFIRNLTPLEAMTWDTAAEMFTDMMGTYN